MPSKREREYARRRYEKQAARMARAARLRRERNIVLAVTIVAFAAVAAALFLFNRSDQQAAEAESASAAAASASEAAASAASASASAAGADPLPTTNPEQFQAAPPASDALERDWNITISTSAGDISLVLHGAQAPQAVANFVFLAQNGFYDGTACHRLLPSSLLQCGDPTATGGGGPGYTFGPIENAPEDQTYPTGTVAMARVQDDAESMGSQFFLVFNDTPLPDDSAGGYSVFGEITEGLDILQQIGAAGTLDGSTDGRPAIDVIITGVEVS